MVSKEQKVKKYAELVELLKNASGVYFIDFARMKVADTINMRRQFKEKGVTYRVAKNTLIRRAMEEIGGFNVPDKYFELPTGLALGSSDPIAPAKIFKQFTEKREFPTLKVAIIEGQVYDGSQLALISTLPTREDLISGILSSLDAPVSGIVGSINAVIRDLASVIEEVAKRAA
ncbi:MAG: 50S ribosomal protein L10 [Candidatus Kapabacteria bacterium]|nr:50S ribosomal protein L10 [Candidatus Kapabacteria bacterium]